MGEEEFDGQIRWETASHAEETACEVGEEAKPKGLGLWECSLHLGGLLRALRLIRAKIPEAWLIALSVCLLLRRTHTQTRAHCTLLQK